MLPVALPVLLLVAAIVLVGQRDDATGPVEDLAGSAASTASSDPSLDDGTCAQLGRVSTLEGCARQECLRAGFVVRRAGAQQIEVCQRTDGSRGAYATDLPEETCTALHRRFLPLAGLCASMPQRTRALVDRAAACVAPRTTYVVHTERAGEYDECLAPQVARRLERVALRTGLDVGPFIADRSPAQCALQAGVRWERGRCVPEPVRGGGAGTGDVLLVGDSIAWRATDELAGAHPSWAIDAEPGRPVQALGTRLRAYLEASPAPEVAVVALGSNPGRNWVLSDYLDATASLPASTAVVWVLPYREASENGVNAPYQIREVTRVRQAMAGAAAARPGSCVVDWPSVATRRPDIVLDGVHPTRAGEQVWADLVGDGVERCR